MSKRPSDQSLLFHIGHIAIVTFAAVFVWVVGHRGVFLLDQSILFDGAWRVYQGQVPYRDFYSAFPPVAFFVQSLFFHIAGVNFSAMVLSGAVLNGLATACVIWLVRRFHPMQPAMALVAGLITALWFAAPLGILWFEQLAFFFNLLAVMLFVKAIGAPVRTGNWLRIGAGGIMALALLSKQNAGAEFIPVALGIAVWPFFPSWRGMLSAGIRAFAGFVAVFSCFLLWVWQFSSLSNFWNYYVLMLRQIGAGRFHLVRNILFMLTLFPTIAYVAPVIMALAIGLTLRRSLRTEERDYTLLTWIVLGCVLFQNLFKVHSDNEMENAVPYLGLVYGLAFGFMLETSSRWGALKEGAERNKTRAIVYLCVSLMVMCFPLVSGSRYAWHRSANEFQDGTVFDHSLNVVGMSRVKWGEPTIVEPDDKTVLTIPEFESLNQRIQQLDRNFFVFVDSTMLYGLHHRVSPQPWLYFSEGHSFRKEELPQVDAGVKAALIRNDVRVVILEKRSWLGNEKLLSQMPQLNDWIHQNFRKDATFGIFEVWVDSSTAKESELRR